MRGAREWIAMLGILVAAGCGGNERTVGEGGPAAAGADTTRPVDGTTDPAAGRAPMWDAAGLEAQPRLAELQRSTPAELGFDPGTTGWTVVGGKRAEMLGSLTFDTPAAAALAAAGALGWDSSLGSDVWEWTVRVMTEPPHRAVAVVLAWGFKDDSVAGQDLQVEMERADDGWRVTSLRQRSHCGRGIADGDLCV